MIDLPTPTEELKHPLFEEKGVQVFVKRDDLTHPEIMGNKWRKLKYNLLEAKARDCKGIVTMGGAYSNHIAATAAACLESNLACIGIIRGEELSSSSNPTLKYASHKGMQTVFVDRTTYRRYRERNDLIADQYGDFYFLPEGGTNELAVKGCEEILHELEVAYDLIVTPIGTGGTFAGILSGLKNAKKALGVSSLKGDFIYREVKELLERFSISHEHYEISNDYHFGGYGKTTLELIEFINWFKEMFKIQLDPIYTGKSFFCVFDMIKKAKFEKNLRIVLLHTGGLQGIEGFNRKNQNIIQ